MGEGRTGANAVDRLDDNASRTRVGRVGWSKTKVITAGLVLDIGSGAHPNPLADIIVDSEVEDSVHRHGAPLVVDQRLVLARAEQLPFRDGAFKFAIASHIAEHLPDPDAFCREIARVASSGYIETPRPTVDRLLDEEYHVWRVRSSRGELAFKRKDPASRAEAGIGKAVYRVFYAGRPDCARPTVPLPDNAFGKAVGLAITAVRATLARAGLLHTRHHFSPVRPLRWRVEG